MFIAILGRDIRVPIGAIITAVRPLINADKTTAAKTTRK